MDRFGYFAFYPPSYALIDLFFRSKIKSRGVAARVHLFSYSLKEIIYKNKGKLSGILDGVGLSGYLVWLDYWTHL